MLTVLSAFADSTVMTLPVRDPVLLDLPDQILSKRLLLRVPDAGDGAALFLGVSETLPALREFLFSVPWVGGEQSIERSEIYCRQARANFLSRRDLPFLMFERDSGHLVGATGLHRPDWGIPRVEVGYWCRQSFTGRGLVTEAVQAMVEYAFTHIRAARIELVTDAHNVRSRQVAERCGFTLEGVHRNNLRAADGGLHDLCLYARIAEVRGAIEIAQPARKRSDD